MNEDGKGGKRGTLGNLRAAAATMHALLVIGATAMGCGPASDDRAASGPMAGERVAEQPSSLPAPLMAYQGTVAILGNCGVGVARVESDFADLYTYAGGVTQSSQRWLRQGQLLVACGVPHRLLGFVFEQETLPNNAGNGVSGRAVVLDANPAATVKVPPGAVALTVDGVVNEVGPHKVALKGLSIARQGPRPVAHFRVALRDGREQAAIGGAGDSIEIASARHNIIEVALTDDAAGIPGWVLIDGVPERNALD